ncbi:MAG: cobalamin-dependent protein, partial [Planctomycetota bacterium]
MRILFVIHQLGFADHISISYLSAIAKQSGHSTHLCVLDHDDFLGMVGQIKPEVIAYSVNILGFEAIVEANRQAHNRHEFVSIMGGPQPTFSPETFEQSGMDAYCVGEGEYAFG